MASSGWDWIDQLAIAKSQQIPCTLVTITKVKGSTPRKVGAKMIVYSDRTFEGTIGGGKLEDLVLDEALVHLEQKCSVTVTYPLCIKTGQCCGGSVEVLFEGLNVGPSLYLFGAGHVGKAVCATLRGTPFRVHLVDERPEWLYAKDLPKNLSRHDQGWKAFIDQAEWDRNDTYVVVMTHSHFLDEEILGEILEKPAKYIGLIGSKTKWERFEHRLKNKGATADQLARVHCPIGLAIGGKAPQEIAISFASQILAMHYDES